MTENGSEKNMFKDTLLLLVGLGLLVKGGDLFVATAVRVAGLLRMPRVIIGFTIGVVPLVVLELAKLWRTTSSRPNSQD
jgi:Ca2+/Na+ antiporter